GHPLRPRRGTRTDPVRRRRHRARLGPRAGTHRDRQQAAHHPGCAGPGFHPMSIPSLASYEMPRTPVQNRVHWRADARRAALLIHDMQDYCLGKYEVARAPIPALIAAISRLRDCCDAQGIPVFYTAQPPVQPAADRALLNDFWGPGLTAPDQQARADIITALAPRAGDTVLTKWRYSAFQRSDLRERLRVQGRDQLIITGVYAH